MTAVKAYCQRHFPETCRRFGRISYESVLTAHIAVSTFYDQYGRLPTDEELYLFAPQVYLNRARAMATVGGK